MHSCKLCSVLPVLYVAKEVVVLSLSAAAVHCVTKVQILRLNLLILLLQKRKKKLYLSHSFA